MKTRRFLPPALVILSLLALSLPALALPPQCDESCTCSSRCTQLCALGAQVKSCGYYGECQGMCLVASALQPAGDQGLLGAIFSAPQPADNAAASSPAAP